MRRVFVDTNVFLRFFLWDIPAQAEAAEELFAQAARLEIGLLTSELVLAEIVWTLESYYRRPKPLIAEVVGAVLDTPNLIVPNAPLIRRALQEYVERNVDFIDAHSAALMRDGGIREVASFDKHFGRFPDLSVV